MTTVGQAGAKIGIPAEACTIATAPQGIGLRHGPVRQEHLGDLNEFLPTVHGFDEFFGYLYHLDAWKTPRIPTIRRSCWIKSARATWSTVGDGQRGRHRDAALG